MTLQFHRPQLSTAMRLIIAIICCTFCADITLANPPAITITVETREQLVRALSEAAAGTTILIKPGRYEGGIYCENLRGEFGSPIVIAGENPDDPPVFEGGANGIHLVDPAHVELRHLIFAGAQFNGINIDDGGSFATPAHHIILRHVTVRDLPDGNFDGIKLSGVADFRIEHCTVERWGKHGSAIDMVGCFNGVIERSIFRHVQIDAGNGVQAKGGSSDILIAHCRFEDAGERAVQVGGRTELRFFRPRPLGYEATNITIEHNTIVGSRAAVAFVSSIGGVFRYNTVYRPKRWLVRVLRENREPGFADTRAGVVSDNIFVFHAEEIGQHVNVGNGTDIASFIFARNAWFCADSRSRSRPRLPVIETQGIYGQDPIFISPQDGDLRLSETSPLRHLGAQPAITPVH